MVNNNHKNSSIIILVITIIFISKIPLYIKLVSKITIPTILLLEAQDPFAPPEYVSGPQINDGLKMEART